MIYYICLLCFYSNYSLCFLIIAQYAKHKTLHPFVSIIFNLKEPFPSHLLLLCMSVRSHGDPGGRVHRRSPLKRRRCRNTGPPGGTAFCCRVMGLPVWALVVLSPL